MFVKKSEMLGIIKELEGLREEVTLASLRVEDQDWVNLSTLNARRDIDITQHQANIEVCYKAYRADSLAKRVVKFLTLFSVGSGVDVVADEDEVQQVLNGFWEDDLNQMELYIKQMVEELTVYGEIFIRYFYNEFLGVTRVGLIDPYEIFFVDTDPENIRIPLTYWRRYPVPDGPPHIDPSGGVQINYHFELEEIPAKREDGLLNVQHVKVNSMSNTTRGVSDLLDVVKWCGRYESWLTDRVIFNKIRNLFHYDVTIKNGTAKDVKAYLAGLKGKEVAEGATVYEAGTTSKIKPGAIRVHTDKIAWDTVQPKIDATDAKEDGRAIKLMVSAGSGIPEHWLGDTGNTNLATAGAMDLPTLKQFEDRQTLLRMAFRTMLRQVIECQRLYGSLPARPKEGKDEFNDAVEVSFKPLKEEDKKAVSEAFSQVTNAVSLLVSQRQISRDTANKILAKYEPLVQDWMGEQGEQEKIAEENPADAQGRATPAGAGVR